MVLGVLLLCCGITAAATAWWVKRNVYASPMTPVSLNATEEAQLQQKIQALENALPEPTVSPEEAKRTLVLTQKEVNAYLAKQGLGETVKVDLKRDAVAVSTLIPIEEGAPLLGGTTLRIRVALGAMMDEGNQLRMQLDDVTLGGVPLPNAWLGDIKGVNLVTSDINSNPTLKRFFDGIKEMELRDGSLRVVLNE
jgi:arginine N-succinyltransferase